MKTILAFLVVTAASCASGSGQDGGAADSGPLGPVDVRACLGDPACNIPLIAAHRGFAKHAPANTVAAYRDAIEAGADLLETDIRTTRDGVLVLMHDDDVSLTTDGTGQLGDMTFAEVQALHVFNNDDPAAEQDPRPEAHRVATLADLIGICRELHCMIDYDWKTGARDVLLRTIRENDGVKLGFVHKSDCGPLGPIGTEEPELWVMCNVATRVDVDAAKAMLSPVLVEIAQDLAGNVDADVVRYAKAQGLKAYTDALGIPDLSLAYGDDSGWAAIVDTGMNVIATDATDHARAYLVQRGLRAAP